MTIPRLLDQGRSLSALLLADADTVLIRRVTGSTFNEDTGQTTPTYMTVYNGPALIRPLQAVEQVAGERQVNLRGYAVKLPYDETEPAVGDEVVPLSSHSGYLVNKILDVVNVAADTIAYWHRLDCEENQSRVYEEEESSSS